MPQLAVPAFERIVAFHARRPRPHVDDAAVNHVHQAREQIEAMRVHAVSRGLRNQPRTEPRALGVDRRRHQCFQERIVEFLVGHPHQGKLPQGKPGICGSFSSLLKVSVRPFDRLGIVPAGGEG